MTEDGFPTTTPTRVLLIEDHAPMRQYLSNLLECGGRATVCRALHNGENLIPTLKECRPDVAIIDVALPHKGGIALAEEIRAFDAHLPILMLSAHNEEFFGEAAMNAGANGCLMKEHAVDYLEDAIDHVVKGGGFYSVRGTAAALSNLRHFRASRLPA